MAESLKPRLERGLRIFKSHLERHQEQTVTEKSSLDSESTVADEAGEANEQNTNVGTNGPERRAFRPRKLRRELSAVNSLAAIKLKMLLLLAMFWLCSLGQQIVHAGFFTFYFPNIFKPKGFGEIMDMLELLDNTLNETRDTFADSQYFWGQLQRLDSIQSDYPEDSACSEVFPQFRELAIAYVYTDFEHFIKPFELYKEHLLKKSAEWYPGGLESKAALPREWEQNLYEKELELKIEWMNKLVNLDHFKSQREQLREIWKSVRRGLDTSVSCIYLRYAYRQIAEDINETALQANLDSMKEAMVVLRNAYKRIDAYKESDKKIIEDIEEEINKIKRFTINETQ